MFMMKLSQVHDHDHLFNVKVMPGQAYPSYFLLINRLFEK